MSKLPSVAGDARTAERRDALGVVVASVRDGEEQGEGQDADGHRFVAVSSM
jgi:hypothetical protein